MMNEDKSNSYLDYSDTRFKVLLPSEWNKKELKSLLKSIQGRKILVVGDVGVDRYITGKVERISPEAPVPIVWAESEKQKLGLAANISDNVKSLGGLSHLVGVIGKDRGAEDLKTLLAKQEISSHTLVCDSTRKTIIKERIVSQNQQLMRIDYESAGKVSGVTHAALMKQVEGIISDSEIVVLEDYSKGMIGREFSQKLISHVKSLGKKVLVDPHRHSDLSFYRGAYLIKPNKREAEVLTKVDIVDNDSLVQVGEVLLKQTDAEHAFLTLGKEGMAVFSKESQGKVFIVPASAREVYDVSGAGDTVITVLAMLVSANVKISDAAVLANIAGGIVVGKFGTATTTIQEMELEIDKL